MNLPVRVSQEELLELLLHVAPVRPVFIWGAPGIGKSSLVETFADSVGLPCVSLLGSQLAPEDIIGIPQIQEDVSTFLPPKMIARKEPYCLFLDELNACSQEVQKAFYSLIHERRIGEYHLPQGSIVIGAGNAAMDVARTAIRKGARYLTCFSLTKKVAASQHEFSYAQLEGVEFEYNKAPVEITDEGVIFKDVTEQEDGKFTDVPDSSKLYPADSVIISISQGPQNRIVTTTEGLAANKKGLLVADETGHTTRPGIFASGDVVNGARTVVEAVAHSKVVAESMHQYMQSLPKEES